jgi:large subunit ribosomal protein L21e
MVGRSHGFRIRTRHVLKKRSRERGKVTVNRFLRMFQVGDRAAIKLEPSVHQGMPHPKYHGRTGVVVEVRGKAYVVRIRDGNKPKDIIARAVHLIPIGE